MDSLAGYESEDEIKEHGDNPKVESSCQVDQDVNYDDVQMDESDEETNNNVPEEFFPSADHYGDGEIVPPEDAPLVFRSITAPREEVWRRNLESRNSSDMDMDENDSDDLNYLEDNDAKEEEEEIPEPEPETQDSTPCPRPLSPESEKVLADTTSCSPKEKFTSSSSESKSPKHLEVQNREIASSVEPKATSSRYERSYKRSHSPDKRDRSRSPTRSNHRRTSRSPERSWKQTRLERKASALSKMGIELRGDDGRVKSQGSKHGDQLRTQIKQVEAKTGITLPSYYNPGVMNPLKYAQQIQKRKLLWGNKSKETSETVTSTTASPWDKTTFKGDNDGKMSEKFKRLMGMKTEAAAASVKDDQKNLIQKQEEMFSNMEAQYQVARMVTHTHRGIGLGYGTYQPRLPLQKNS